MYANPEPSSHRNDQKDLSQASGPANFSRNPIAQHLFNENHITAEQLAAVASMPLSAMQAYSDFPMLDQSAIARAIAHNYKLKVVELDGRSIPAALLDQKKAFQLGVVPVLLKGDKLFLAIDNPERIGFIRYELSKSYKQIEFLLTTPDSLRRTIEREYGRPPSSIVFNREVRDKTDGPIVELVNRIVEDGIRARASDIFFDSLSTGLRVRYQIDGVAKVIGTYASNLIAPVISRIKVLGDLNIAESRSPQNGRVEARIGERLVDIRVGTLPGIHGETVTLRLLEHLSGLISFAQLGMRTETEQTVQKLIHKPNGIVLVTGPVGSGKSTTLHAALTDLNTPERRILTIEDPVEYDLPGAHQTQINERIGVTFQSILREELRHAPNVIFVGEIRDTDTAQTAFRGALTGHLLLSTLHTNDALGAVTRLLDLGVEPYLVGSVLRGVVAQRLVRKVCDHCAEDVKASAEEAEYLKQKVEAERALSIVRAHANGCPDCSGQGYKGRLGVFETLEIDEGLGDLIREGASAKTLREYAKSKDLIKPMMDDAIAKVFEGKTTVAEVKRVL